MALSLVDSLYTPLQFLKGVGPRKAADLKRAGLVTVEDLLYRLPFRYEDRSRMQPIASLRPGTKAAVLGEIKSANLAVTRRRGFKIFHAVVGDASGAIRCTWMNQAFLADVLKPHLQVVIFGDVKLDSTGLHFMNPEYELVSDDLSSVHTGRVVPFYEKTGTVTPNMQRRLVRQALDQLPPDIPDPLPADLRARLQLVPRRTAIEESHFPPNEASVDALNAFRTPAQHRLIFEEFFLFQIGHAWRRHASGSELKPFVPVVDDRIRASAAKVLPFKLTPGQRQAVKEIVDDMLRPEPMHRLLQGDVGAGKTIVALLAAIVAMENGLQVAFMAPTEILAGQHYGNIARLLASSRFRVDLLTGSTPGLQKHTLLATHRAGHDEPARRHARAGAGAGHVPQAGPRRDRRAAPVRRRAACRASRQGAASRRAADDRDADSAHARADRLQRARRLEDPGPAAGPQAGDDAGQAGVAARRDLRADSARARRGAAGVHHLPARRGVGEGRSASRRPRWPTTCRRRSFRRTASRCCTAA